MHPHKFMMSWEEGQNLNVTHVVGKQGRTPMWDRFELALLSVFEDRHVRENIESNVSYTYEFGAYKRFGKKVRLKGVMCSFAQERRTLVRRNLFLSL